MTEKLTTLMHAQADSVDFATPDLEAMVRTGDRRIRHRRLGTVAGIAAVATGVALVAPFLAPDQQAVEPAAPETSGAATVSWVDGTALHEGGRTFSLDFRPRAYVRTAEGYVFSDRDGQVWSWVDEAATHVGSTDHRLPRLVSDEEAGLAGWFDPAEGALVVLHQDQDTYDVHQAPAGVAAEDLLAIDAGTAYWAADAGLLAVDLATGHTRPVRVDGAVTDVEDGLLAVRTEAGTSVRELGGDQVNLLEGLQGEQGAFSDDARYFTSDADEPQVYDVAAGQRVALDVGGRMFATGYEWLPDGTLVVIAAQETSDQAPAVLLRCVVPSGACTESADLGDLGELDGSLVLPVGQAMG